MESAHAAIEHVLPHWEVTPTGKTTPEPVGATIFGTDESPGKLGFFDQCRMAYCLGLVGQIGYFDLKLVAKVRNRFAHHMEVTSFSEAEVAKLCGKLESPGMYDAMIRRGVEQATGEPLPDSHRNYEDNPSSRFMLTVQLL